MKEQPQRWPTKLETLASAFILPAKNLSSFGFGYVLRDTRQLTLSPNERVNRFPASPLCSVSWVFKGEIFLEGAKQPIPNLSFSGPQPKPIISHNPGPIYALTMAIYPEAWLALTGTPVTSYTGQTVDLREVISADHYEHFSLMLKENAIKQKILVFENAMTEQWRSELSERPHLTKSLEGWAYTLIARATTSPSAQSLRQVQRRLKRWTGLSERDLKAYVRLEDLFALWISDRQNPETKLSELAIDGGFTDQSHMGRDVKRLIGISPAKLNQLIDTDESFWFYKLMGERY